LDVDVHPSGRLVPRENVELEQLDPSLFFTLTVYDAGAFGNATSVPDGDSETDGVPGVHGGPAYVTFTDAPEASALTGVIDSPIVLSVNV
jgi:hypothetical protein